MAGSYRHCRKNGKFTMDLIENLGDAHEALEMMFFMITHLSNGDQRKIKAAENAYYASLRANSSI